MGFIHCIACQETDFKFACVMLMEIIKRGSVESLVFIMSLSVVEKCIGRKKTCEIKLIFANISTVCHEM